MNTYYVDKELKTPYVYVWNSCRMRRVGTYWRIDGDQMNVVCIGDLMVSNECTLERVLC